MDKEAAVLALYTLGCSREEIDDLIHIEALRRKNEEKARKKTGYIGNSKRYGIMKTDEKRMDEDEKKKERAMMEEGLYITVKEV